MLVSARQFPISLLSKQQGIDINVPYTFRRENIGSKNTMEWIDIMFMIIAWGGIIYWSGQKERSWGPCDACTCMHHCSSNVGITSIPFEWTRASRRHIIFTYLCYGSLHQMNCLVAHHYWGATIKLGFWE